MSCTRRRLALIGVAVAAAAAGLAAPAATAASDPTPVLAYYYIWFDPSSWSRAKTDYPVLGRYSSDERRVMARHVKWAKQAGIDGFIVSWKAIWKLNRRLERLMDIAARQRFKLVVIYQGLDFEREPLPIGRVAVDFDYFIAHYANNDAFDLFEKPVVIWSGSWRYTREEIASVTAGRRDKLLILASEKNVAGYERVHDLVDGDAYYWSSANPETYTRIGEKLDDMGRAAHADHGLWIAPVAPGFDARLVGGATVVPRRNGETLRKRWNAAIRSSPDAIGVISWNEFSENTHIEPSLRYGSRYLGVLADIAGASPRSFDDIDSSESPSTSGTTSRDPTGIGYGSTLLAGLVVVLTFVVLTLAWRVRRRLPRAVHSSMQHPGAGVPSPKELP
jgi:hypothetical protein